MKNILLIVLFIGVQQGFSQDPELKNGNILVQWKKSASGYVISQISTTGKAGSSTLAHPSGEYTLLFSETSPDTVSLVNSVSKEVSAFPDTVYKYIVKTWRDNLRPVPMNRAGTALHFFPTTAKKQGDSIVFGSTTSAAKIESVWKADPKFPSDLQVIMTVTASKTGYFSVASPTLATLTESELQWGIVPGICQGPNIAKNLVLSYAYGQGLPDKPVVFRERTASTLAPILSNKSGISFTVIPEPGTARDPWESTSNTHSVWELGLSLMNRKAQLTPTAYHPVLGQKGSYLKAGEKVTFSFRYSIQSADWYTVFKHAAEDVYRLPDFLALKHTRQSLTSRILSMQEYLHKDSTSMWRVENYNNRKIGAQAYLGGVVGSDRDAMKNSDYGAMWMLADITQDSVLLKERLPYARNFKLEQQQEAPGFFQGAAIGQYYLSKSKRFTEEWGDYVEPIALTYYSMLDIGNMLLFEKNDAELKARLRIGGDRLLQWQYPDGHWEVGYDRKTEKVVFTDLKDFRPTFYGLIVAYRMLGDKKYLDAAIKGADWFIKEASSKGFFLGVCGDLRFAPDFATGQSSQAMLDLYDLTGTKKYQQAAIDIAKLYTTSIYTQPVPSKEIKTVNGRKREDWEIAQAGLSFEHGGGIGSANIHGPILLASHAGLFVRIFGLTGDSLFITMARTGALGRDGFVDSATSVASYYWDAMNRGSGPYPHHAWWQVGWLTDYLLSEIQMRSGNKIVFPQGFITPKVGAHKTFGFAPGKIFGEEANLALNREMVSISDPYVDYYAARTADDKTVYLMLLNDDDEARTIDVKINASKLFAKTGHQVKSVQLLDQTGKEIKVLTGDPKIDLPVFGLRVLKITAQ